MEIGDLLRVVKNRAAMLRRDHWSRDKLLAYQARELQRLRDFAYLKSPFYYRFHESLADRPFAELPVLTKAEMMASFDEVLTDSALKLETVAAHAARAVTGEKLLGRYTVSSSSGSTGQRGYSVFDRDEWAMLLATYGRPVWWAGLNPSLAQWFDPVRAAVYTSPVAWHQTAQVRDSAKSRLMPSLHLDATRPAADVVAELNEWMPQYLATYASLARGLAEERLAGRLHITPHVVAVGGEVLTPQARHTIERAFGPVLFDTYGATETGIIAAECPEHRGLHLCEDTLVVEVVDKQGREVPPGEFGDRVLVTVLWRRTQPLIRYELSDRVRLSPHACPCGRPFRLIDTVQGRVEETLDVGGVAIDPIVFESVLDTVPALQWQVVQEPDAIEVLLVKLAASASGEQIEGRIRAALASKGATPPTVRVRAVDAIPRGATGKSALVRKAAR